jgi:hypothetical protein
MTTRLAVRVYERAGRSDGPITPRAHGQFYNAMRDIALEWEVSAIKIVVSSGKPFK